MLAEITLGVATVCLLPVSILLFVSALKVLTGKSSEYEKLRALTKNNVNAVLRGQLSEGYSLDVDYSMTEGMVFDSRLNKCISQSTISDEAIQKVAF